MRGEECLAESGYRRKARRDLLLECLRDHVVVARSERRPTLARRTRHLDDVFRKNVPRSLAHERRTTDEHLVSDASEGVDVTSVFEWGDLAVGSFGCHIGGRPDRYVIDGRTPATHASPKSQTATRSRGRRGCWMA